MARYRGRRVLAKRYPYDVGQELLPSAPAPSTLEALNHPNVQRFKDDFLDEDGVRVHVFKWLKGRTLAEETGRSRKGLSAELLLDMLRDTATALRWFHHRNRAAPRVHGDVSLGNIFFCEGGRFRLIDALALEPDKYPISPGSIFGTLPHTAPEILDGNPPGTPSDIFSLGTVAIKIASRALPWQGLRSPSAVLASMRKTLIGRPAAIAASIPGTGSELITAMVEPDPRDRPTADEVVGGVNR